MSRCLAELCGNWTGDGCICQVLGLEPVDLSPATPADGCQCDFEDCICGVMPGATS